jgi:hypothetical protein
MGLQLPAGTRRGGAGSLAQGEHSPRADPNLTGGVPPSSRNDWPAATSRQSSARAIAAQSHDPRRPTLTPFFFRNLVASRLSNAMTMKLITGTIITHMEKIHSAVPTSSALHSR